MKLHGLTLAVAQREQSGSVADVARLTEWLSGAGEREFEVDVRGLAART